MRSFALLPLAFAAIALAMPVADGEADAKTKDLSSVSKDQGPTGCVQHCPPNPLGGSFSLEDVKSIKENNDSGAKALNLAGSLTGAKSVSGTISYQYSLFVYSYVQTITTEVIVSFNQKLITCGVQPYSTITELLVILQLEEDATIEAFLRALLGSEAALVSELISIISYIFSTFGLGADTTIIAFINARGITMDQTLYIFFITLGIWEPPCQTCS
ncbi:hypothetical protein EJ03DRAFT_335435 [Teratosphaeria nubilosa]|uniref:Uncharacterized protein n=1 Tax=Teratosphaeria nubilosa TaxID=161662 RepID=A0A6G1LD03_9PEZI|nr:hypothetical protein EJ03DRAFT_335435 [Teratosphaeria nubilosa]